MLELRSLFIPGGDINQLLLGKKNSGYEKGKITKAPAII